MSKLRLKVWAFFFSYLCGKYRDMININANILVSVLARSGGGGLEAETTALLARMDVQPDSTRKILINNLIKAGKSHGWWNKADMLKIMAAHDQQAALLNWIKNANNSLLVGGGNVFTTDKGIAGNAGDSYIDLNYTPSVHGVNFTLNSASFIVATNNDNIAGGGNGVGALECSMLISYTGRQLWGELQNAGDNALVRNLDMTTKGFHGIIRTSSTNLRGCVNFGYSDNAKNSTSLCSRSLWLGATNGYAIFKNTLQYSFAFTGGALSQVEYEYLLKDVNAYMKAVNNELLDDDLFTEINQTPTIDILTGQSNTVWQYGTDANLPSEYNQIFSNRFCFDNYLGTIAKQYPMKNTYSLDRLNYWGQDIVMSKLSDSFLSSPHIIMKASINGIAVTNWDGANPYVFNNIKVAIDDIYARLALNGLTPTFRSLWWGQGEYEVAFSDLSTYQASLTNFINNLRAYKSELANIKIYIQKINLGFTALDDTKTNQMNDIYDAIAGSLSNVYTVDVNSMGLSFINNLHYDANSIIALGQRWSDLVNV